MSLIQLRGLRKTYKTGRLEFEALRGVDLDIEEGQLVAIVGLSGTEIGMLRCIGAQSKDVRRVFSSEGLFLAFLGWIVGLPVGFAVYEIMSAATQATMKLSFPRSYSALYVGWSLVFALVGTVIVIAVPLRRATKMKPGDALRYE
jgi:ABC-type antimicrobial peptide transport system permease subunit